MLAKMKLHKLILLIVVSVFLVTSLVGCEPAADCEPITIYTPNGTPVSALKVLGEMSSIDYNDIVSYQQQYYPNVVTVRNPTAYYNCHSYAWHSTSSTNQIWIQEPNQQTYWTDGSYSYISSTYFGVVPSNMPNGTRISYVSDDHSAISNSDGTVTSKWGNGGLYKHAATYCPYDFTQLKFYSRN